MPEIGLIKNKALLASSRRRRQALDLLEAGLASVLPDRLISDRLSFDRTDRLLRILGHEHPLCGRIFVLGAGKASGLMAQSLEKMLGSDLISAGIVVEKADPADFQTSSIRILQAGHPIPDQRGLAAAEKILALKSEYALRQDDTVICLISGGGSSLLPAPAEGISLADKQLTTRLLLSCGADIYEINSLRKHLSRLKGGRLARLFSPARVISLIISDVIGNDLSVISSGPTFPDSSTYQDAWNVLAKYGLLEKAPRNVVDLLRRGLSGELEETPKQLDNASNYILGDNRVALEAMAAFAAQLGIGSLIVTDRQTGDTDAVARQLAAEILENRYAGFEAVLLGGETTPHLPTHPGKGGRNQHLAAWMPVFLAGRPGEWVFASLGTDGSDYLEDVAGGIVDQSTLPLYRRLRPDYAERLKAFDSHTLLAGVGGCLILTGDTHTNVGDIMLFLLSE